MNKKPVALVAEDHTDSADIFRATLESVGFAVEVVYNGTQALAFLQQSCPALVVLDLFLPGVKGRDVLAQIRSDPRLEDTKVIVASAVEPEVAAVRQGGLADEVLLKPVSFKQLRDLAVRLVPESGS